MKLDDLSDDAEAEPQPSVTARRRGVGLTEAIEHEGQHLPSNPNAGVGHANPDPAVGAVQADGNEITGPRKLDRVGEDVRERMLQAVLVGTTGDVLIETCLEPNAFRRSGWTYAVYRCLQDIPGY